MVATETLIVHVCQYRLHLGKLLASGKSGIWICNGIWIKGIGVVLISLDHVGQGIKGWLRVKKLEIRVDSMGICLHEKQVGVVGVRVRSVEAIGVGTNSLA